jgi:PUA domain protein
MRRYHLSKKKIKEVKRNLKLDVWVDGRYEIVEAERDVILVDGVPAYFEHDGAYYPTVILLLNTGCDKGYVTVDMGAVKHVLNGANVFAAGIVDADSSISPGDGVYVRDEKYGKPLAVGIARMNGEQMKSSKSGVAVETLHYYGDKITKI